MQLEDWHFLIRAARDSLLLRRLGSDVQRLRFSAEDMRDPILRSRVEQLSKECGCSAAIYALCGFLCLSCLVLLAYGSGIAAKANFILVLLSSGIFLIGLAASTLAGKAVGLFIGRLRLRHLYLQLHPGTVAHQSHDAIPPATTTGSLP
jgi:hypothetical protein